MASIEHDNEKSPFTSSGDLEDESNLEEILMDRHGSEDGNEADTGTAQGTADDDAYADIEDDKPEDEEGIEEFN